MGYQSMHVAEQNGLRGKLQKELPWTWCYAHQLELACRDGLSRLFKVIDDMSLRLYYLYAKSPKKSHELADIVEDIKEVWQFAEGGNLPVRSQSSQWINHKRKAQQRLVDRYGAYLNHIISLVEDETIKSNDRAHLKGYLKKWN